MDFLTSTKGQSAYLKSLKLWQTGHRTRRRIERKEICDKPIAGHLVFSILSTQKNKTSPKKAKNPIATVLCVFGRFGGTRQILIHITSIDIWGPRRMEGILRTINFACRGQSLAVTSGAPLSDNRLIAFDCLYHPPTCVFHVIRGWGRMAACGHANLLPPQLVCDRRSCSTIFFACLLQAVAGADSFGQGRRLPTLLGKPAGLVVASF